MLDQPEPRPANIRMTIRSAGLHHRPTIQLDIQIPRSRYLNRGDALQLRLSRRHLGAQLCRQLRSNRTRSLPQPLRQLKRHRQRQLSHRNTRRLLHRKLAQRNVVLCKKDGLNPAQQGLLNNSIHTCNSPLKEYLDNI